MGIRAFARDDGGAAGLQSPTEECVDGVRCVEQGPCGEDQLDCDGRCVDPLTSRTDCGGCNRACARNEQCVEGECQPLPGCVVVCDTNEDCNAGEVCLAAGSCTESRCVPVQPLTTNTTQLTKELATGLVTVTVTQLPEGLEDPRFATTSRQGREGAAEVR